MGLRASVRTKPRPTIGSFDDDRHEMGPDHPENTSKPRRCLPKPTKAGAKPAKAGYLQIGTAPATHTVRCDADATHKAWTNIPPDISGGHDRQGVITVTASSGKDPV